MNALLLDIGLAPMPDTEFHACKHYNKFIEYAASNTVGIFSDVKPYDRLKERLGWKLICDNTSDSWYRAIKQLLDHPDKLDHLKQQVADMVATRFHVQVIAKELWSELQTLTYKPNQCISAPYFFIAQSKALCRQLADGMKRRIKH